MQPMRHLLAAITVAAFGIGALLPTSAQAYSASTGAEISLGNLVVQFDNQNAELIWADEWFGAVGAGAADIPGSVDEHYDAFLGNNASGSVTAATSWANSAAQATAGLDGIAAATSAAAEVDRKYRQGTAFGNASLDNFFYVRGGDAGDLVTMTVALNYSGLLAGIADAGGAYDVAVDAFISLFGEGSASDIYDDLLNFAEFQDSAAGTDDSVNRSFANILTFSQQVQFGEVYWLYAEADSEATAAPVVGSLPLLLLGSVLLGWRTRRA